MKRCSKCILPASFPGIVFDSDGVCNYCHNHTLPPVHGEDEFEQLLSEFRGKGKYDCIMTYSGGRDSSFAVYQMVTKFNMNPLIVTYDWGMMTDYAKENWRITTEVLDLDHYIIVPNQERILSEIRMNVLAFLKKPRVQMFPLFTSADKSVDFVITKLAKKLEIPLVITSGGSGYENTIFKTGFFGVFERGLVNSMKLGTKIGFELFRNPRYINSSLVTGLYQFIHYFSASHRRIDVKYTSFYSYVRWNEATIVSTIKRKLDWVSPPGTDLTWRTDDGTAPFYNYIHYKLAGFSEHDTLRSVQIRENDISRKQGLEWANRDNIPRYEGVFSIRSYCELIGVPFDYTLKIIDSAPRYYE